MNSKVRIDASRTADIAVLSVSPHEDDHASLQRLFGRSRWLIFTAQDTPTVRTVLQDHDVSVVLCESDLIQETWVDVLHQVQAALNPPSLIVTSRIADDRLWAEALNLGAWDVLAKPFDRLEVVRGVKSAWEHWRRQVETAAKRAAVMKAAS